MELKYSMKRWELGQWESSNRTFMELKCSNCCFHSIKGECSNRTFMELKSSELSIIALRRAF